MAKINPEAFLHDSDKKAMADLKKIPAFDKICSKLIDMVDESFFKVQDMSSKVRISKEQMPRIYNMLVDICEKLSIAVPDIYLEMNRSPNAYTYGDTAPAITITTGLLECLEDDEIYATLAHECGHIACNHVPYSTIGRIVLNGGIGGLDILTGNGFAVNAVSQPFKIAFYYWMRCSEFSADRAAVFCCGGADSVVETMMRLAGGTTYVDGEINKELFINQANEYDELIDSADWNKLLEFYIMSRCTHPFLSVRAKRAIDWSNTEEFRTIQDIQKGFEPDNVTI